MPATELSTDSRAYGLFSTRCLPAAWWVRVQEDGTDVRRRERCEDPATEIANKVGCCNFYVRSKYLFCSVVRVNNSKFLAILKCNYG